MDLANWPTQPGQRAPLTTRVYAFGFASCAIPIVAAISIAAIANAAKDFIGHSPSLARDNPRKTPSSCLMQDTSAIDSADASHHDH
jgi:hypothetical protein